MTRFTGILVLILVLAACGEREPEASVQDLYLKWSDGTPVALAPVIVVRDGRVLESTFSDLDGRTAWVAGAGGCDLWVDATTMVHRVVNIAPGDSRRVEVIPEGETIAGTLHTEAGPPSSARLELALIRDRDDPSFAAAPRAARAALHRVWRNANRRIPVSADGSFRATGCAPGWKGRIALRPAELWDVASGEGLAEPLETPALTAAVAAPATGIRLEVRRLPEKFPLPGLPRTATFIVTGEDGLIPEAVAASMLHPEMTSAPAAGDGSITFALPADETRVRVGAVGWAVRDVALGEDTGRPVTVRLARANRLVVRPGNGVPAFAAASVACDKPLFDHPSGWQDPVHVFAGATDVRSLPVSAADLAAGVPTIDVDRGMVLTGIRPGVPFTIRWTDHERRTGEITVDGLGPAEWRQIEVAPPPGAVPAAAGSAPSSQAPGDWPRLHDTWEPEAEGGRTLVVTVADADGCPFEQPLEEHGPPPVILEAAGGKRFLYRIVERFGGGPDSVLGPGVYEFRGLPETDVRVRVRGTAGEVWEQRADTSSGAVTVIVPAHGTVYVSWGFRLEGPPGRNPGRYRFLLCLAPVSGNGRTLHYGAGGRDAEDGVMRFPQVAPGAYSVWIERGRPDSAGIWRGVPCTQRAILEVAAHATSTVTLAR